MANFNDDKDFILNLDDKKNDEMVFTDDEYDEKESITLDSNHKVSFGVDDIDINKVTLNEAMNIQRKDSEIDLDEMYNNEKRLQESLIEQQKIMQAVSKIDTKEIEKLKGKSIMIEGLDGSGKGAIVEGLKEYFSGLGLKVFDLKNYWKTSNKIPGIEEVSEYDVIMVCEPTLAMIGKVIREEIIRTKDGREYSALTTAHAFALDREILYKKLLIPAKNAGKIIVQERGIISSLVYQPVQDEMMNIKELVALPGNKVALKAAPEFIIITRVDPLVVMERLKQRNKKDNAIFENISFQRKIQLRYESEWLKKLFEHYKSKIIYIDTNPPSTVEETKAKAIEELKKL